VSEPAWKAANRAHWDEKVALHIGPRGYDLTSLRAGRGRLNAIEEAELWPVDGKRILHLQCHFGADSLKLVQRDATVVGLDFSAAAIDAARQLASELGLADRTRFVQADLYDAPKAIPEPAEFDMVFVTWGAIGWLPDIRRWAEIVAHVWSAFPHIRGRFFWQDRQTHRVNRLPRYGLFSKPIQIQISRDQPGITRPLKTSTRICV
jgi:SAM-dependent methyltransferase